MNRKQTNQLKALLAAVTAGVVGGLAFAAAPQSASAQVNVDEFRSGGCSGCVKTQMSATIAQFANVVQVFRLCTTGTTQGSSNVCAGAAGLPTATPQSQLQDYYAVTGTLRDCGTSCDSTHLGRNGGGPATYYISANGSLFGVQCASNPKLTLGFLGIYGSDQHPGGGDDPGAGTGHETTPGDPRTYVAAPGLPPNWPSGAGPTYSMATVPRAALEACDTKIKSSYYDTLPAAVKAGTTWSAAGNEFCVVDVDANADGIIQGRDTGVAPGFADIGTGGNESSDLAQSCTAGFSDLPSVDFQQASLNSRTYDQGFSVGAQIFKIIANTDVYPLANSAEKITLQMPQLEALFGGTNLASDACSWTDLGGRVSGDATAGITVCYREDGSGTRETFRNTFLHLPEADHAEGVTASAGPCQTYAEAGGGAGGPITQKNIIQAPTSTDMQNCVQGTGIGAGKTGQVGYVNASRKDSVTPARFYSVPVFGIDPDAQTAAQLRNLVKCGQYPYWGPLSGGRGAEADPQGFFASHVNAMSNGNVFDPTTASAADYLPGLLGAPYDGVAFTKTLNLTAASYDMKFDPSDCTGVFTIPTSTSCVTNPAGGTCVFTGSTCTTNPAGGTCVITTTPYPHP